MILVIELIVINILAFILYGVDKRKAHDHKWRLSEFSLIFIAVIGGAPGAFIGMRVFRHKTRKPKFYITIPVFLVLHTALAVFCLYQNYNLQVSRYDVDLNLEEDVTIVQISDLHNQYYGQGYSMLLDKVREEDPDIIAVTGDLIDSVTPNYKLAKSFLYEASKIAKVCYITGNHEVRLDGERFDKFVKDITSEGVIFIDDDILYQDGFVLAGIADESLQTGYMVENQEPSKPLILLAHEPDYIDLYKKNGADLVLAGHIHGGQFIIPGKGGLLSPDFTFFPEYYGDMYDLGSAKLVVSRGLGNSLVPVRINNYPEIVVTDLT